MDLRAANCVEVLVRNFTVAVQIEAAVKVIELLLSYFQSPVIQVKLQLRLRDTADRLVLAA